MGAFSSGLFHGTSGSPQMNLSSVNNEDTSKITYSNDSSDSLTPSFITTKIDVVSKLAGYALNPDHPSGKHKARVFKKALGYTQKDAEKLAKQIREKAPNCKAVKGKLDEYGQRWTIFIPITGNNRKTALVETAWIVRPDSNIPELITAYVAKEK